jgi:predicted metalloprotease
MAIVVFLLGGDPTALLEREGRSLTRSINPSEQQEQVDFVSVVLGSTEDVWSDIFRRTSATYRAPALVMFSNAVDSGCGLAQSAVGPFYCPLDSKVYLDLGFFYDLQYQLDAPGDFARAYVIAHEVGHHVQNLLGRADLVHQAQARASEKEANQLSVRLELQADCYAGIWAHFAQAEYQMLEPGDIEEALNAASQIGDDRLQAQGQGYVVPDSFTHGSSAQRYKWFQTGYRSGVLSDCDTFSR